MKYITVAALLMLCLSVNAGIHQFNDDKGIEIFSDSAGNAHIEDSMLILMDGTRYSDMSNMVLIDDESPDAFSIMTCTFDFSIEKGAEGFGIAFIEGKVNVESLKGINWSEPTMDNAFSVGFDIYDPATINFFDSHGNYADKPQREISVNYNGLEIAKRLSNVEFRDSEMHHASIVLQKVCGGALCTVSIDDTDVFRDYFIPHFTQESMKPVMGSTSGELTTYVTIDNLSIEYSGEPDKYFEPEIVQVFSDAVLHGGKQEYTQNVEMPVSVDSTGRVLLTLKLSAPPGGFDRWDRGGAVYITDGDEKYEIMRFITPFGRGYEWTVDVTRYGKLLTGQGMFTLRIDTWTEETEPEKQTGWSVDAFLEYYPGYFIYPSSICNVWSGMFEYGNPEQPIDSMTKEQQYFFQNYVRVELLMRVTGHGQYPASQNAGEFLPAERIITVNRTEYTDTIWKEDCYLNPCRPQGGTWKFSRAGWAPGSVVEEKIMNLSSYTYEKHIFLKYKSMPYVNENRDEAKAWHWIETQLFVY